MTKNHRNVSLEIMQLKERLELWRKLRADAKNLSGKHGTKWRKYVLDEIDRMQKELEEAEAHREQM